MYYTDKEGHCMTLWTDSESNTLRINVDENIYIADLKEAKELKDRIAHLVDAMENGPTVLPEEEKPESSGVGFRLDIKQPSPQAIAGDFYIPTNLKVDTVKLDDAIREAIDKVLREEE